jgi:hypothetical protein
VPPSGATSNGLALFALILGILAVLCLGPFAGVVAIVLGMLGLKKASEIGVGRGQSIAGIVLGGIGTVLWVIVGIALLAGAAKVSDNLHNAVGTADPSTYDVTQASCAVDDVGFITFTGTIKNTASSQKNFSISGEFRDKSSDAVIDTSTDIVTDLNAGDTAQWKMVSTKSETTTQVTCKVTEVDNWFN